MEIYIEDEELLDKFSNHFKLENAAIKFVSTDIQDKGTRYTIHKNNITSIEENNESVFEDDEPQPGFYIWWKQWSEMEGKYFTCSANFVDYELTFIS